MNKNEAEKRRDDGKKKLVEFEEEKHVYSAGRSTVEVTVKLRKRKSDHKSLVKNSEHSLRTGSWADLLNRNSTHQIHPQQKYHKDKKFPDVQITKTKVKGDREPVQVQNLHKEIETQTSIIHEDVKKESETLREENKKLLVELTKAKADLKECFTTIKELRKLSDLLKYENECLTESRKQRVELEQVLKKTITENHGLKKQIHHMNKKYNEVTGTKINQISKYRDAIKDLKSTIEDEIDEIRSKNVGVQDSSPSLFHQFQAVLPSDENLNLDGTKGSEVQMTLDSASSLSQLSQRDEDGSSTQYLDIAKGHKIPDSGGKVTSVSVASQTQTRKVAPLANQSLDKSGNSVFSSDLMKVFSAKDYGVGMKGDGPNSKLEYQLKDSKGRTALNLNMSGSGSSSESLSSNSIVIK